MEQAWVEPHLHPFLFGFPWLISSIHFLLRCQIFSFSTQHLAMAWIKEQMTVHSGFKLGQSFLILLCYENELCTKFVFPEFFKNYAYNTVNYSAIWKFWLLLLECWKYAEFSEFFLLLLECWKYAELFEVFVAVIEIAEKIQIFDFAVIGPMLPFHVYCIMCEMYNSEYQFVVVVKRCVVQKSIKTSNEIQTVS